MKLYLGVAIFCAAVLCPYPSASQDHLRVELIGGNYFNMSSSNVFYNWGSGWTVGGGASIPLDEETELLAHVSFHRFGYVGGYLDLSTPALVGTHQDVSGAPSSAMDLSVGARVFSQGDRLKTFAAARLGLSRTSVGAITVYNWNDSNPAAVTSSGVDGSGLTTINFFASFGLGFALRTSPKIVLMVEGDYSQTFGAGRKFIPVLATLQYEVW
jgi:hypothetical protein